MSAPMEPPARSRLSPAELLEELSAGRPWLLVQDLDGVCMELVRDPRRRRLDPDYVRAARQLEGGFAVLTNGEHEGSRGVNRLVDQALAGSADPAAEGLYLPGLGAGGVQLQSRHGQLTHPGVSQGELAFLAAAPAWLHAALAQRLPALLPAAPQELRAGLIEMTVLDNPLSPSLNLNPLMAAVGDEPARRRDLQALALELMQALLKQAASAGLGESFFLHLAPNLGSEGGRERLKPADSGSSGSTDFQLMLRGALKEVGLLVLINHWIQRRTGTAPLGLEFHGRDVPHDHASLLELCTSSIDPALMPRLVGVGDTITSQPAGPGGGWLRGGSDRGFLTLLQELGGAFGMANRVLVVDSSGGEVDRPSMADGRLEGLTDPEDPLWIDTTMAGGPGQYIRWFRDLAARQ